MMKRALLSLVALGIAMAPTADASAQPCCHRETVHIYEYRPVRVHRVKRVRRYRPYRRPYQPRFMRWSAGVHLAGVTTTQELGSEGVALGGMGGHLRFRGYRFGAELSLDVLGNRFLEGSVSRVSVPFQASALLYLIPRGMLNLYLLGGFQAVFSHVTWDLPNLQTDQSFTQFGAHGGVGAELRLGRRISLTADLRFFGLVRNEEGDDGQYYAGIEEGAVVPAKTSGAQLNLGVSFHF